MYRPLACRRRGALPRRGAARDRQGREPERSLPHRSGRGSARVTLARTVDGARQPTPHGGQHAEGIVAWTRWTAAYIRRAPSRRSAAAARHGRVAHPEAITRGEDASTRAVARTG